MRSWLVFGSMCCTLPALARAELPAPASPMKPLRPAGRAGAPVAPPAPLCTGDYADELALLAPRVRELERTPQGQYSYCLRTTATYECLSYASDGTVRHARRTVVAHGTGFAYRRTAGDTYLITNDHVASWPAVTDEDHRVDDVPTGCKMVSEAIKLVDDEGDGYEANDHTLTRVVSDPGLDVAVLKTRVPLQLIPYRIGRSAAVHAGNVVAVRGFPLGAFQAMNVGKVVNAYDHDTARDWDHVDFVVDALLSPGNSGSPVLAVSCKTGEYELIGVYHAGYVNGSALNVVVGIDQVRDLMTTLKRSPRLVDGGSDPLGPADRAAILAAIAGDPAPTFFPFGNHVAVVRAAAEPRDALVFEVYTRGFPLADERLVVLEDLPRAGQFGEPGRAFFGNRRGLRRFASTALDGDAQAQLGRILGRLRADALAATRYRSLDPTTRQGVKRIQALERARDRQSAVDREAAQSLADLADRLAPKAGEPAISYRGAVAPPQVPISPPVAEARSRR